MQTETMPVRGNTFKIFIGNLNGRTTSEDVKKLFEAHGTVVESDVVKNYGFIHMQDETEGKAAIEALNGYNLHGKVMVVEASTGSKKTGNQRTKIFVGNLSKDIKLDDVKNLFENHGRVVESDMLTNYAFIHMDTEANTQEAIRNLDGFELDGFRLRVQESTSRVRQHAGMGNPDICFRCGSSGHWSKECPRDGRFNNNNTNNFRYDRMERGRGFGGGRFDPYGMPPAPAYGRERMRFRQDDYENYERFDRYYEDPMYERRYGGGRMPPPPHPPMHDEMYERRMAALPPPPHRPDYLRYGRRSPNRYPPPPPMMGSYPPSERRF